MWKILSPRSCRSSAETLQSYLNSYAEREHIVKVNWGNSGFSLNNPVEVVGNKAEAVARSVNKAHFFQLCKDLGTVPVVSSYEGPCFQHYDQFSHDGRGVKYVDRQEDFIPGVFTTKAINGLEIRSYFCYDMQPMLFAKALLPGHSPTPVQNSLNYGYTPLLPKVTGLRKIVEEMTRDVANRVELSYGAIDFILDREHTVWVLESNSAPTLIKEEIVQGFTEEFAKRW